MAVVLAVGSEDLGCARLLGEIVVDCALDALPVGVVDDDDRR